MKAYWGRVSLAAWIMAGLVMAFLVLPHRASHGAGHIGGVFRVSLRVVPSCGIQRKPLPGDQATIPPTVRVRCQGSTPYRILGPRVPRILPLSTVSVPGTGGPVRVLVIQF